MKKGLILYVTEGKEEAPTEGVDDLIELARSLGVSIVCVATSEDDVMSGWFRLVTRGMSQVELMRVAYNEVLNKFESQGNSLRLCG